MTVEGDPARGKPAASVQVRCCGETFRATVDWGDIAVIPNSGEAVVEVQALGGAVIGKESRVQFKCTAAAVGIIVDARGRPLVLPEDPNERAALNAKWARQIGAIRGSERESRDG